MRIVQPSSGKQILGTTAIRWSTPSHLNPAVDSLSAFTPSASRVLWFHWHSATYCRPRHLPCCRWWRGGVPTEASQPFHIADNSGFLRTLTIREGKRTGERLIELTTSDDQNVDTAAGPREAGDLANELASALLDIAKRAGTK